jgi:hypothetical protein
MNGTRHPPGRIIGYWGRYPGLEWLGYGAARFMASGLEKHINEVAVVFLQFLMAFAAEEAHLPLDLRVVAHCGKAPVLVLDIEGGDGDAFGHFIEIGVIAAIWAGNLHFP